MERVWFNYAVLPVYYDRNIQTTITSSDPLIAEVGGQIAYNDATGTFYVKGLTPGTVTITAALSNGLSSTVTVTVTDIMPVSLAFAEDSIAIMSNSYHQLVYTLLPENATNQQLTWVSDEPAIVTVGADGLIRGNLPGRTVVRAETVNNIKAHISVTVYSPIYTKEVNEKEPNNGVSQAQMIMDMGATLLGSIADYNDIDYYSITASTGRTVHIKFSASNQAYNDYFVVRLMDENGGNGVVAKLQTDTAGQTHLVLDYTVVKGPICYIMIYLMPEAPVHDNVGYYFHSYMW